MYPLPMPTPTWTNLDPNRRERVLTAALTEFGAKGYAAGSLNVIANEAGVAKGSLFQYFDDKLDLFNSVCTDAFERIGVALFEGVDDESAEPLGGTLSRITINWLGFLRDHPVEREIALLAIHEHDPEAAACLRHLTREHVGHRLLGLVRAAADRGELRADADPLQLLVLFVQTLRYLNTAPFYPQVDPVLALAVKTPAEVEQVSLELVAALMRAYAATPA